MDGAVRGLLQNGVNVFLGIPYAAAPVGDLRWRPPQPVKPWRNTLDANQYASSCPQSSTLGVFAGPTSVNENCLYLNVFSTGNVHRGDRKPVIVWIHGGGNIDGASNDYDATKLATGGPDGVPAVVVTLNYRLGIFGVFAHPAIDRKQQASGNYLTLDQQAALQWVHRNIAAFGGDPDKVTIAGQSAGAINVAANLLSPLSKGLFQRAILMSSPGFAAWLPTAEQAQALGMNFATAAGCRGSDAETAKCLRGLSVARVLQLQGTLKVPFPVTTGSPFADGYIIPTQPEQAWKTGGFNQVPVMGGGTKDEATLFQAINEYFSGPPQAPTVTTENYASMVAPGAYCVWCNAERKMPAGVAQVYPVSEYGGDAAYAYSRVGTDGARCREIHVLQSMAEHVPVYAYEFAYEDAPFYFPKLPGFKAHATHTADIQFLFSDFHGGNLGVNLDQTTGMPRQLNVAETGLSDQMVGQWTRFADSGNPNGAGNAPWPRFSTDDSGRYLIQDLTIRTEAVTQMKADHKCSFFDPQLAY